MTSSLFLNTISNLRSTGEIVLYNNVFANSDKEKAEVIDYLEKEYEKERANHPYLSPDFDANASLWASELVYFAVQLILYRKQEDKELTNYIFNYSGEITPSAIISADLILRYIPDFLSHLKRIDSEDPLIDLLESQLHIWHFSGISYDLNPELCEYDNIISDPCLFQMYVDRVVKHKHVRLAKIPVVHERIKSCFGEYSTDFWNDFNTLDVCH